MKFQISLCDNWIVISYAVGPTRQIICIISEGNAARLKVNWLLLLLVIGLALLIFFFVGFVVGRNMRVVPMVFVPGGEFEMGGEAETDTHLTIEEPLHEEKGCHIPGEF